MALDPTKTPLDAWLAAHGTFSGTFTVNGVTYTNLKEVEWRRANNDWLKPTPRSAS